MEQQSTFGVVDLLAILPTYLSLLFPGSQYLLVIRILRVLRIFRVLKLVQFIDEANVMNRALRASGRKILVFIFTVLTLVVVFGSVMYLIEGGQPDTQFTSIPRSVYWAIVTMTTVGYGDIAPQTVAGQALAACAMILGYAFIIVPIGVFSAEVMATRKQAVSTQACPSCAAEGHDVDAVHCKYCGAKL